MDKGSLPGGLKTECVCIEKIQRRDNNLSLARVQLSAHIVLPNVYPMRLLLFVLLFFAFASFSNAQKNLSVLTYNIRFDNPGDGDDAWPKRRDHLAAQLRFFAPDVFGIQEGLLRQLEYLNEQLPGYQRIGVGRDDGKDGEDELGAKTGDPLHAGGRMWRGGERTSSRKVAIRTLALLSASPFPRSTSPGRAAPVSGRRR